MKQIFSKTVTSIICIAIFQMATNFNTFYAENNTGTGSAPVITGVEDVEITKGEEFDILAGVKAEDKEDGDLTKEIECIGSVGQKIGKYFIQYIVIDSHNNVVEEVRKISVVEQRKPTKTPTPTAEVTATPKPTVEVTSTPTPTAEVATTPTPTVDASSTPEPTAEVVATPTPTVEVVATPTPTVEVAVTPTPTVEVVPTPEPEASIEDTDKESYNLEDIKEFIISNKETVLISTTFGICFILIIFSMIFGKTKKRKPNKTKKRKSSNNNNNNDKKVIKQDNTNIPEKKNNVSTIDDILEKKEQPIVQPTSNSVINELPTTTNKKKEYVNLDDVISSQPEIRKEPEYVQSIEGESILSFEKEKDPNVLLDDMLDDIDRGNYNSYDEYIKCMKQASLVYDREIVKSNEVVNDLIEKPSKPEEAPQEDIKVEEEKGLNNLTEEDYVSYDDKMYEEIMSQEVVEPHSEEQNELFNQIVKEVEKAKNGKDGFYYRKMVDGKVEEVFIEYDE